MNPTANSTMPKSLHPGSMTARQFASAAKQAKASPLMLARARRVLVDCESIQDVADSNGVTRTQVYKAIHKVRPL